MATVHDVPTPALLLDGPALRRNIAAMSEWARGTVEVRPHAKIHKCAEIARLQLEAGAIGITTATVPEAVAMVDAGAEDILIANQVAGGQRVAAAAELAGRVRVTVAVDDPANAAELSHAASEGGSRIGVLVDVDVGMLRGGVRSTEAARDIGRAVLDLPGLDPRGVMGYEGHAVLEPDREQRARLVAEAMERLGAAADALEVEGFPVEVVSAGGTNTFDMTGSHPRVTELQTGSYVVMDATYLPLAGAFEPALRIAATVVSRQDTTAVLDCGTKVLAADLGPPQLVDGPGTVREVHEEHTLLDVEGSGDLAVGERVQLVPGYCGGTINLHDFYYVVDGENVVDTWAIAPRGAGWPPRA